MKFLFFGLGSIGQRHVKNLYDLGHRDFFSYRQKSDVDPFETELGIRRVSSYEEGLASRPDAVFITNPTAFHVRDATRAVQSGAHVFVEKPLGSSAEGIHQLQELAKTEQRVVFVAYQLRFHPILSEIRTRILKGEIGDIVSADITVGQHLADWHPGEDFRKSYAAREDLGGGVILTLSHELDYASWLFGPVVSVFATGGKSRVLGIEAEEEADVVLTFASGDHASVHMNYLERPARRSLKIIGSKGKIEWDYFSDRAQIFLTETSDTPEEILLPLGFERNTMYREELLHFLKVVKGDEESCIPLTEAVHTLAIAIAAKESQKSGIPVKVEEL